MSKIFALSLFLLSLIYSPSTLLAQEATSAATASATPVPQLPPADTGISLTVSPSLLLIDTEPGTTQTYTLKLRNNNPSPELIALSLKQLITSPDGSYTFQDFQDGDPILNWISFTTPTFIAEPNQWTETTMTFSPSSEAKLGHYFAILFNRQNEAAAGPGETKIIGAPAIIALADIASEEARPELRILDFKTTQKWYDFLPVEFELTIQNTGNIHLQPFGNVFLDQGTTQDIGILTINDSGGFILPGATRTYTMSWADGAPLRVVIDPQTQEKKLDLNLNNLTSFRLGKYAATALAAYDDGSRDVPLESIIEFWVFPWQAILIFTSASLLIIIGIIAIFRLIISPFRRR